MINQRLKQLFFAVVCLDAAPAAAATAPAELPGHLLRNVDRQPALGSRSTALRPPMAANDNAGAAARVAADPARDQGRTAASRSTEMTLTPLS
jgi:hypothetical protein